MAGNLEESGIRLVVDGADKAVADVNKVNKSFESFGKSLGTLTRDITSGASFSKIVGDIQNIGSSAGDATGIIAKLGLAGTTAGSTIAIGMATAVTAIAGIAIAAGAAVLALVAIGGAVNAAVTRAKSLRDIQESTGADANTAGRLFGAARITGVPVATVTGAMQGLNAQLDATAKKADKAFGTMGAAADKAGTRLSRLNQDYAASIDDITTSAAERIKASNDSLVESHTAMLEKQARADEDYARNVADGRAALSQRIADIEASTAASIASLTQRRSRGTDDYARETETAQQNLAQSIIDINTNLNDKLTSLRQGAADQNTAAIAHGADAQAKITEDLQSKLAGIEQKYADKRQGIQEKIADPSTNPILRAFYKTQIGAINGLQKAEESGARIGASAKEAAAQRETQAQLAEVQTRLQREEAFEQAQAQQAAARQQQEATARQAERLREYTQQTADLTAQIAVENAQRAQQTERARADQATREADLKQSYERQAVDAQASYDKQVADAAVAQAKIGAETEKRLAAEKQQYDRSIEDINTALASAGGGAAAAVAQITPLEGLLNRLGISADEFKKKPIAEQIKVLGDEANRLIAAGDLQGAKDLMTDIFGPEVGGKMFRYFQQLKDEKGFMSQKDIDDLISYSENIDAITGEFDDLVVQLAISFLPLFRQLIAEFKVFWKEHGPEVVAAIKNIGKWIITDAVPAVVKIIGFVSDLGKGFVAVGETIAKAIDGLQATLIQMNTDIYNAVTKVVTDISTFTGKVFDHLKGEVDKVITFIGTLKTKFDEFIAFLGRIQLPSWLGGSGGNFTPTITYPQPPPSYSNPYSGGIRSQSIPATGAQMAASNVTNTKMSASTNSGNTIHITNTFNGKTETSTVRDGIADGLFRAGFRVSR